jgi:transposase-like protein
VRKLTESDKQEILKLYRESAETTSTLAERYEVSNSTISRLLKSTLAEDEYEYLVSLKRAARTPEGRAQVNYDQKPALFAQTEEKVVEEPPAPAVEVRKTKKVIPSKPAAVEMPTKVDTSESTKVRRVKRRSSAEDDEDMPIPAAKQLELLEHRPIPQELPKVKTIPNLLLEDIHSSAGEILPIGESQSAMVGSVAEMFGEEVGDEDEEDDLDDLDDLDEDDDDDDDDDDNSVWEAPRPLVTRTRSGDSTVRVLPLTAATLPRTCYLVIDRSAELITRPLRDFGDLGQIPNPETQQRTLPVFDNHRVAKRFSTKRDRVIKVPDSRMLHKARYHLQAKGITRLLIDGQVYSLSSV